MITAGDFLAGGGGVTEAMSKIPQINVRFVLNHDKLAIRTNLFNHRGIKHYWADFYKQDEHEVEKVDFMWASIECTQHSKANGGREKKIGSYTLGFELLRYIIHGQPYIIGIENVPEFKKWSSLDENGKPEKNKKGHEFERWKSAICALGYEYHEKIMNAADYGLPTRRERYFAFFTRIELGFNIRWPQKTHNKNGTNGLKKWVACKNHIDLTNEGQSIFGRQYNPNIRKGKRIPLVKNTLKRIAGGIKKHAPELAFIFQYYGNGLNAQSIDAPLNTVTTKDRHVLVTIEKKQFVADHCHTDNYNLPEDPLNPILTRETKQLITVEKKQFLKEHMGVIENKFFSKYYSGDQHHSFSPDEPFHTIRCVDGTALVDVKAQYLTCQNNSNGKPEANVIDINDPLWAITTNEKFQFITAHFNSGGNPETQVSDINSPIGAITGSTNKSLVTALLNGDLDFDIKIRFLDPEELSQISTFPAGYFTNKQLKLSRKDQTKLIGNAVPPEWARMIIEPVANDLDEMLNGIENKLAV